MGGLVGVLLIGTVLTVAGAAVSGFLILFAARFAFRFITAPRGEARMAYFDATPSEATPSAPGGASAPIASRGSSPRGGLLPRLESRSAAWLGAACLGGLLLQELVTSLLGKDAETLSVLPIEVILCAALAAWLVLRRSVWAAGLMLLVMAWELVAELAAVARGEDGPFWLVWMGALLWAAIVSFSSLRARRYVAVHPASSSSSAPPAPSATFAQRFNEARKNRVSASDAIMSKNPVLIAIGTVVVVALVSLRIWNFAHHSNASPTPTQAVATAPATPAAPTQPTSAPPAAAPIVAGAQTPIAAALGDPPVTRVIRGGLSAPPGYAPIPLSDTDFLRVSVGDTTYDIGDTSLWTELQKRGFTGTAYASHRDYVEYFLWSRGTQSVLFHATTSGANFVYLDRMTVENDGAQQVFEGSALLTSIETLLHAKLEAS